MSKKTLPPIFASAALYVLAVASGVLLSKPVAAVLAVVATVGLLLVGAGYERVQRHLPDLGRLPFVVDYRLHTGASKQSEPNAAPIIPTGVLDDFSPRAPKIRQKLAQRSAAAASIQVQSEHATPNAMGRTIEQLAAAAVSGQHQRIDQLASFYYEGEALRARILLSASSILGDLFQGTANQRQVQRERLARDWDARVLAVLPDDARPKWIATAVLPERSLGPATTIAGVREFLAVKLDSLKEIIDQSGAGQ